MWSDPPQTLSLQSREVHVWRSRLEQPPQRVDEFLRTLDDHERERASRFHFDKHRRHFVVGRGVLRLLLARYLGTQPEVVQFNYGSHGKPSLGGTHNAASLRFNASHSGEMALYAFAQDQEVGVDIEYIKSDFAPEEIAERFFSPREIEILTSLPKQERAAAFFRLWTRKEAYIKAIGVGLSHPLNEFDVTLPIPEWSMFDLEIGPGYAAAVTVSDPVNKLTMFDLKAA